MGSDLVDQDVAQIDAAVIESDWLIIDCRERDELAGGVIPNSRWLPLKEVPTSIESIHPDKKSRIVVYCARGQRSQEAVRQLLILGYKNAASLVGGFAEWRARSFPVSDSAIKAPTARYRSQMLLPEVGEAGQAKLAAAKVLLIGAGGLGSPISLYLAGAGVGTLGLVDHDLVEESNLHRQVVHSAAFLGKPKVESAANTLRGLNPQVNLVCFKEKLTSDNVDRIFPQFDLVIDGTDNYQSRYFINDSARRYGLVNVHGAVFGFQGQVSVFGTQANEPCYRCLFPEAPPKELRANCSQDGVLGPAVGVIGSQMAVEALKVILGVEGQLKSKLMTWDGLTNSYELLTIEKDDNCVVCGTNANKPA